MKKLPRRRNSTKDLFKHLEDMNLFIIKFHTLDLIVTNDSRFGHLKFSATSEFEQFSYIIKIHM